MPDLAIKDVFFDLDHTLWDFDRNSALAFDRVFKRHHISLPLTEFLHSYEPINLKYWKLYREESITKEELRRGRLIDVFGVFKMEFPLSTIDTLANTYIDELPVNNFLHDGTFEILEYLQPRYGLHIITNGFKEVQHLKLRNSGIQKYFKTITTSEEVGAKKPHRLIFETAMAKAQTTPQDSLMIDDSIEADIFGAKNAGMYTIFFNPRNERTESSLLSVPKLSGIMDYL